MQVNWSSRTSSDGGWCSAPLPHVINSGVIHSHSSQCQVDIIRPAVCPQPRDRLRNPEPHCPRHPLCPRPRHDERTARSYWNRRGHRENDAHWCDSSQNTSTNGQLRFEPPPSCRLFMLCCSLYSARLGGRLCHSPKAAAGQA